MILELLISYISVIFSLAIQIFCFKKLTGEKLNISLFKIVSILIFSIFVIFNNLYMPSFFKGLVTFSLIFILVKIWFNNDLKITLYYTIILCLVSLFLDFILSLLLAASNYGGVAEVNEDFIPKSCVTIIVNIINYFIFCIPRFINVIHKFEDILIRKKRYDALFVVAFMVLNFITSSYIKDYSNYEIFATFIIIIIFVSILMYILLRNTFNHDKLQIKYNYLQESIKNYENIVDDYSELKHNLNHDLLGLKSVANKNAEILIDEIIKKYNKNYHWITRVGNIPKGIQGLLYVKLYEVKHKNINVEVNAKKIKNIISKVSVENYSKLCDFIGIALDNAIEAANKSTERSVYISFDTDNNKLVTKIMNTFSDNLDLEKIGNKNYSTKRIKSGIGLNYLKKITNKKVKIKKEIINDVFIVSLILPLKK